MSDFFKKFLLEDPRRFGTSARYVGLAAFGKHPGWDDHVEDLGLETESLNLAKTVLYVNGIGGQIDSGAWEKLDAEQQLPAFKHLFVWQRSGQILIGRLWSSSDGKGRKRYPMVVCLHFIGVTLGWALKQALPALAELEEGCVLTVSAEDVRGLLNRKRAALRETTQGTEGRGDYAPVTPEALHRILQTGGDGKAEGFLRVLYQIRSQLGTFASGTATARGNPAAMRAQQIRVPVAGENPEQALLFWTRFFLTQIDASVPLLLTLPLEAAWLDVTAGEPESHEFFCLRASPKAVPMASEVPYKLDDAFRAKAAAFLESFQRGETIAADLQPAASASDVPMAPKSGWRKWLGVGVVIAMGAVTAVLFLPKGSKPQTKLSASDANPGTAAQTPKPQVASTSAAAGLSKTEAPGAKERQDKEAAAARLEAQKKESEAMAAAAKLKAEAEAAVKEKERQAAEVARREREEAAQRDLQEQQRKASEEAAAKKKIEEQAEAKMQLAAAAPNVAPDTKAAVAAGRILLPESGEMTNSIGMVLMHLPSGIWVGKFEVTQAEYQKVMGSNPSKSVNDRQPVERVAWTEANAFCRKLTELERGELPAGKVYTLPTEKQWKEFLGGQKFEDLPGRGVTFKGSPAVVGQSGPANKFGLFDVLGNVWEWCLDGATGEEKLLKGGAFNSPNFDRTSLPDVQMPNFGFRCVLTGP